MDMLAAGSARIKSRGRCAEVEGPASPLGRAPRGRRKRRAASAARSSRRHTNIVHNGPPSFTSRWLTYVGMVVAWLLLLLLLSAPPAAARASLVVVGATGNLAAKYLWPALFRLALRARLERSERFAVLAGASQPKERGEQWLREFFASGFERRVCGEEESCLAFLRDEFLPSVEYMPLRTEEHYREARAALSKQGGDDDAGRIVYLAIPPQFFLQTCELVDQFLRIPSQNAASNLPYLRVVIEKPFGTSTATAQQLAVGLRRILREDEVYVMDHYAGKEGVRGYKSYLEANRELLRPLWNSNSVKNVHIEMTETETLEGRIQYFHTTGIVRDVMVNHLHLLLGISILPWEMHPKHMPKDRVPDTEDRERSARLAFTRSLRWSRESLYSWQYSDYHAHFELDERSELPIESFSDLVTPTAALVSFSSADASWNDTTFTIAAAKAAADRHVVVEIAFRSDTSSKISSTPPCTLTVTVQAAKVNNHRSSSFPRIQWSCDLIPNETHRAPPGWSFTDSSKRNLVPTGGTPSDRKNPWHFGDDISAYDTLLWDVGSGDKKYFADIDELLTSWHVWTPIVEAAESIDRVESDRLYETGTFPWSLLNRANHEITSPDSRASSRIDEL